MDCHILISDCHDCLFENSKYEFSFMLAINCFVSVKRISGASISLVHTWEWFENPPIPARPHRTPVRSYCKKYFSKDFLSPGLTVTPEPSPFDFHINILLQVTAVLMKAGTHCLRAH